MIIKAINEDADISWLVSLESEVLNGQNFSDKEFLLMEKAKEDRYPKQILRSFLCQYLLAKTYTDMFEDKKIKCILPGCGFFRRTSYRATWKREESRGIYCKA